MQELPQAWLGHPVQGRLVPGQHRGLGGSTYKWTQFNPVAQEAGQCLPVSTSGIKSYQAKHLFHLAQRPAIHLAHHQQYSTALFRKAGPCFPGPAPTRGTISHSQRGTGHWACQLTPTDTSHLPLCPAALQEPLTNVTQNHNTQTFPGKANKDNFEISGAPTFLPWERTWNSRRRCWHRVGPWPPATC